MEVTGLEWGFQDPSFTGRQGQLHSTPGADGAATVNQEPGLEDDRVRHYRMLSRMLSVLEGSPTGVVDLFDKRMAARILNLLITRTAETQGSEYDPLKPERAITLQRVASLRKR